MLAKPQTYKIGKVNLNCSLNTIQYSKLPIIRFEAYFRSFLNPNNLQQLSVFYGKNYKHFEMQMELTALYSTETVCAPHSHTFSSTLTLAASSNR